MFTWQKPNEVVPVPADDVELESVVDNLSMYCDDGEQASLLSEQLDGNRKGGAVSPASHDVFRCNVCDASIAGFRYTCVQCSDLDLCGSCEAVRAHHQHYVLRVPADRHAVEVQLVLAAIRRHLLRKLEPITQHEQDRDDVISIKSEVKSEEEDNVNNNSDDDDDYDDDDNQNNNDAQKKSHEDDVLNTPSSPGPQQRGYSDGEAHSMDSSDEAPPAEGEGARGERNTKIYLKRAVFMKMKERVLPWAQNVQMQYSNEARVSMPDAQPQTEEAVVLSETDAQSRSQDVNSHSLQFVKKAKFSTKIKDVGTPAQINDLGKRVFKIAGKQSLLKIVGQLDSIAPDVQLKLITQGEQSEIIAAGRGQDVNSLSLQVPSTHKFVKDAELPIKINDVGAPQQTNDLGTQLFKIADKQSLLKVAGQLKSIAPGLQLELIAPDVQSEIIAGGAKPGILVPGLQPDIITAPSVRLEATEQDVQPNIRELECSVKLQTLPSQILANTGQKPEISVTTDSCDSRTTLPTTSTHKTYKRTILIEKPGSGDTEHAVPVKRCLSSDFSRDMRVYSYNPHDVMPDCTISLPRLPDAIMNIRHRLSAQTRTWSGDSRYSSDEENR